MKYLFFFFLGVTSCYGMNWDKQAIAQMENNSKQADARRKKQKKVDELIKESSRYERRRSIKPSQSFKPTQMFQIKNDKKELH